MGLLTDKNVILNGSDAKEMIVREWWRDTRAGTYLWRDTEEENIKFIAPESADNPVLINLESHCIDDAQVFFDVPPIGPGNPMYKHFRINKAHTFAINDSKTALKAVSENISSWDRLGEIPPRTVPLSCNGIYMNLCTNYVFSPVFPDFTTVLGEGHSGFGYDTIEIRDLTQPLSHGFFIDEPLASNIHIKATSNTKVSIPQSNMKIRSLSQLGGLHVENISGGDGIYIKLSVLVHAPEDAVGGAFEGLWEDPLSWCEAHGDEGKEHLGWVNVIEMCYTDMSQRKMVLSPWDWDRKLGCSQLREEYMFNIPATDRNIFTNTR